jgi:hypothetical protein
MDQHGLYDGEEEGNGQQEDDTIERKEILINNIAQQDIVDTSNISTLINDEEILMDSNGFQQDNSDGDIIQQQQRQSTNVDESDELVDDESGFQHQHSDPPDPDVSDVAPIVELETLPDIFTTTATNTTTTTTTTTTTSPELLQKHSSSTTLPTINEQQQEEQQTHSSTSTTNLLTNRYLLLNSDPLTLTFTGYKVWYDEACSMLILVRRGEFRCISLLPTASTTTTTTTTNTNTILSSSPVLRFKYDRPALDVKISSDLRWVAIQQSDTSVALLKPSELRMWSLECSEKRMGNIVLRGGSIWMNQGSNCCLTLVTRLGLECHLVPEILETTTATTNKTRTSLKALVENVDCFWCLSSKSLILLSCGELGREMRPFFLGELPKRFIKWPKFILKSSPSPGDVALVELYNEPWIVCVFPSYVSLHRISSDLNSYVEKIISFGSRAPILICGISTIDSLLFLHARQANVSMMVDVKDTSHQTTNNNSVLGIFAHPLPIGGLLQNNNTSSGDNNNNNAMIIPDDPYGVGCVFLPPYWVLDAKLGKVWKLEVNLKCAAKCAMTNPMNMSHVTSFLLRRECKVPSSLLWMNQHQHHQQHHPQRMNNLDICIELQDEPTTYGKAVFLTLLYENVMNEEMSIVDVEKWLLPIHRVWNLKPGPKRLFNEKDYPTAFLDSIGLKDVRAVDGSAVVFQFDMYRKVLLPCLSKVDVQEQQQQQQIEEENDQVAQRSTKGHFAGWLAAVTLEYVKGIIKNITSENNITATTNNQVESFLYEFAFRMLLKAGRVREIHQLTLYKIPNDSPSLAEVLITCGDEPARQVGWDMLKRLGLYDHLCLRLLEYGQIYGAIQVVMENLNEFVGNVKIMNRGGNLLENFLKIWNNNKDKGGGSNNNTSNSSSDDVRGMLIGMFSALKLLDVVLGGGGGNNNNNSNSNSGGGDDDGGGGMVV